LPLSGKHQRLNAALAIATTRVLESQIHVDEHAIHRGLLSVEWPGRLQLITRPSGGRILLDGAHNLDGAKTLANCLKEHFPGQRPTLILGILEDKNWAGMCELLAPLAGKILVTAVGSERAANPDALREACLKASPAAEVEICISLTEALAKASDAPLVVVTGSLYLVGEALELLADKPTRQTDERGLNEWSQSSSKSNRSK